LTQAFLLPYPKNYQASLYFLIKGLNLQHRKKIVNPKSHPKPTSCFCNILENTMMGGETASFVPTLTFRTYGALGTIRDLFIVAKVEGSGEVPSPANDGH
jgi:hypothetical protein